MSYILQESLSFINYDYFLIPYLCGIGIGGIIGIFNGLVVGYSEANDSKRIFLKKPFKNYEMLLNTIIANAIIVTYVSFTGITSMCIVALFPISVPYLLFYYVDKKEKEKEKEKDK